jgi:hydroxypyruvate reductase
MTARRSSPQSAPRCAIVTGGAHGANNEIVDALPRLKIIAINGIGIDAVDLERARARSVRVTTTPDVLTEDVADLALGLMLATSGRICVADRFVRTGGWLHEHLPLAAKMSGKRLGILGLGHVGPCRGTQGGRVRHADHLLRPPSGRGRRVPLPAGSRATGQKLGFSGGRCERGFSHARRRQPAGVERARLRRCPVARGSVVDEPALVAALAEGRLGGAGLDVFAHEPDVPRALWDMDNVVLQPHQGSATVETRRAMADLVLVNLAAHFAGREPVTPIV